jgi:tRNA(Ile)-lysidine synthase
VRQSEIQSKLDENGLSLAELLDRCEFHLWGKSIRVAVSGGPDSMALAVLAKLSGRETVAIQVDHGLRQGSDLEGAHVARELWPFGIPVIQKRVYIQNGPNLEDRARTARLLAIGDAARGHTLDDQAETVLANLLRGAFVTGLAGIAPGKLHPIIRLRRSETRRICSALNIRFIDDPTNTSARFRRNRIRHELLPLANDIADRDVAPLLARLATNAAELRSALVELCTNAAPIEMPGPILRFFLSSWCSQVLGLRLSRKHLIAMEQVITGQSRAHVLPGRIIVRRKGSSLVAVRDDLELGAIALDAVINCGSMRWDS